MKNSILTSRMSKALTQIRKSVNDLRSYSLTIYSKVSKDIYNDNSLYIMILHGILILDFDLISEI